MTSTESASTHGPVASSSRLVGLAYLSAAFDAEGASYSDLLSRLAIRVLGDDPSGMTATSIAARLGSALGMAIPTGQVDRSLRQHEARKTVALREGVYHYVGKATSRVAIDRASLERKYAGLCGSLVSFAARESAEPWSAADAQATLGALLERHAPELGAGEKLAPRTDEIPLADRARQVVAAQWANHLQQFDDQLWGYLTDLLKGRVLASALVDTRRAGYESKFRDTAVFLDTPEASEHSAITVQPNEMQFALASRLRHVRERNCASSSRPSTRSAK